MTSMLGKLFSSVGSFLTSKVFMISAGVVLTFLAYFYWSQSEISYLVERNATLQGAFQAQEETISVLNESLQDIKDANAAILRMHMDAADRTNALADALRRVEIIAQEAPETLSTVVTNLSAERNRCLELATGAAPVTGETNSLCPDLTSSPIEGVVRP